MVTLRIKNFVEIAQSSTVFEIQAFLCFAFLKKNSKIQNGRYFWQIKYSLKLLTNTLWVKNFAEIALSRTVFEIQAFLCFANFCKKFENSKWPSFLVKQNWGQQSYPAVQKKFR